MVTLLQLWLPILLSGVFVFIASSLIHMLLKWHNAEYHGFSNEDEVRAALRAGSPTPGIYFLPHCKDMKQMADPAMQAKFKEGPIVKVVLRAGFAPSMGKPLAQWFVYCLMVSAFCAYVAAATLPAATPYLHVFQVIGTVAFMAYAFAAIPHAIWWGNPWSAVLKDLLDGLIYGLLTAGTFGCFWPQ
jgi:hypothetical protein